MFGLNLKLPPEKSDGQHLKVKEIFVTIQGEGPYAGRPSLFIRLSGCNLACKFCDTDFDDFELISITEIFSEAEKFKQSMNRPPISCTPPLIVITGGEPLRQNIASLCQNLLQNGYLVQIESNGTIYPFPLPEQIQVVCSPKSNSGKYFFIHQALLPHIIAIKFLISSNLPGYTDIAEVGQTKHQIPVYVQPMDQQDDDLNERNLLLAQKIAQEHNAILSLQLHKIIGIR